MKDNTLKAIRFERPDFIPMTFHINASCWNHYDHAALQDLMEAHPFLFPNFERQEKVVPILEVTQKKDEPYTDPWACIWETAEDGITGSVHHHPLATWDPFENYRAPDPACTDGTHPFDWTALASRVAADRAEGKLICGGLPHGHTFLRLQDIRGYENLLFDMLDEEPNIETLIDMVEQFNLGYVKRWMQLKPDMMIFPEDLGMQIGPMISPDLFRQYIKPSYERIMKPARDAGCIVHMHSDGDLRDLIDDVIGSGVDVINLQDLVNGIDWIAERFAGKTCVDLDIDRQEITPRGTPQQIDALIREEVEKVGSKEGGLMMIYGLYPGVPLANVKAVMDAMERYALFYS